MTGRGLGAYGDHLWQKLGGRYKQVKGGHPRTDGPVWRHIHSRAWLHSDEHGQPSKAATKKLEMLEAEIARLRKQRAQQEALLKARQASDTRVRQLETEIEITPKPIIKYSTAVLNWRNAEHLSCCVPVIMPPNQFFCQSKVMVSKVLGCVRNGELKHRLSNRHGKKL